MGPIFTVISLYIFAVWTRAPSVLQATEIAPYIAFFHSAEKITRVKLGIKKLLNKEQIGFKELFTDYQLFYTINLLLNKELLPI